MRTFVAFELPAGTREQLAAQGQDLAPRGIRASWVRSENLHLTLVFLGETPDAVVAALESELARVFAPWPELRLEWTGPGAFPPRGKARVLWCGVRADGDLEGLQRAVARGVEAAWATAGLPWSADPRPFRPHVTLARCRQPWARREVERWAGEWSGMPDAVSLDHGSLIASELRPEGARYRTLARFPMAAPASPGGTR